MLKLPKGLKKKKKGKKSKRKDEELFTEEELEKYRKEHQSGAPSRENEEWSKFQDLTTGIDSVLKKTQGDLDRIKSTSFFQRIPAGPKEVDSVGKAVRQTERAVAAKPVVEVTEADFPQLCASAEPEDRSEAPSEEESEEAEEEDDIFDTSYVEAVERGEVRLAYVPDSPEEIADDDIFDTSHVDALIKGQDAKVARGKKTIDIGVAVEVLTGRIDNVSLPASKRTKRVIPGDLIFENEPEVPLPPPGKATPESAVKSILDVDEDIPISTPIDLSISLHTSLIQQTKVSEEEEESNFNAVATEQIEDDDEFAQLAAESREVKPEVAKVAEEEIKAEAVLEESWSVFEADSSQAVFAQSIVEDQLDSINAYGQDDPFDTSFADAVIPSVDLSAFKKQTVISDDDDDDFDPRADEIKVNLNNRRKSSVRIHLTDPSGLRESITSDDLSVRDDNHALARDLLGGSTTDLSQIGDSPLDPTGIHEESEYDPFDTTNIDKIVAPGKAELELLEKELIGDSVAKPVYRVPSDPDFDPRAEEPEQVKVDRRPSRPENLIVSKSVVFRVDNGSKLIAKSKPPNPVTPYYSRDLSITEDIVEDSETTDIVPALIRTRSDEDLAPKTEYQTKRRHSEFPQPRQGHGKRLSGLLETDHTEVTTKVLTPIAPKSEPADLVDEYSYDPFDTSFAADIAPGKAELSILAKEFSCEEPIEETGERDLLEPSDDLFQVKALSPEPSVGSRLPVEDRDPFDTSFADHIQPGRGELKLLESEFLN